MQQVDEQEQAEPQHDIDGALDQPAPHYQQDTADGQETAQPQHAGQAVRREEGEQQQTVPELEIQVIRRRLPHQTAALHFTVERPLACE